MKNSSFSQSEQHHQIALTLISGIGTRRARTILGYFSNLEEFFREKKLNLHRIPGIPPDFVHWKHRTAALEEADRILHRLETLSARTVFLTESEYPQRLKNCDDAPLLLYLRGKMDLNVRRAVAVVGTRHATNYGRQLTEELVGDLRNTGALVISGIAYGIDVAAHKKALSEGLQTVGVLGHGIDFMYPAEHRNIAQKMCENGGLLTEIPPGLKPEPMYFPMRNRIVAGLADALVVVESGEKGGSLITANQAFDYNRDVFAFPGDVHRQYSRGCLKLIQQDKARILLSPSQLTEMMSWNQKSGQACRQQKLFPELSAEELEITALLSAKPDCPLDVISYQTKIPVNKVSTLLLELEFKGLVRSLPGKKFQLLNSP